MTNSRRIKPAADVAVGYAADHRGHGVVFAAIHTGNSSGVVRLSFRAPSVPALDGLGDGYAALGAVGAHLKARGFSAVRIRLSDPRVVADLSGTGSPPKSLAMAYVNIRCALHSLGPVRLQVEESAKVCDLTARAQAEIQLTIAA